MRQQATVYSAGARDFVRRHRPDYQIIIYIGVLLLLGLVVLYAISPARVEGVNSGGESALDQAHFMQRQLLYLFMGIIAFAVAAAVPLQFWQRHANKILLLALGSCGLLAILGATGAPLALCAGGACRWFDFGLATFQPAELVKFALLLFSAGFLGRKVAKGKVNDVHETIIPLGLLVGISIVFIIGLQKDMGTGLAMLGIVGTMLFVAGVNRRIGLMLVGAVTVLGFLLILIAPHRIARVVTFLGHDSVSDVKGSSYHITQAKIALGTGGLFGLGLGKNVQSFGYLPEAPNDSIFAVMGESFGFLGLLGILIFLSALFLRLLSVLDRTENMNARLIVAGVFGWLATQSILNIGAMVGIVPLTGITLPLLSFGGSSLLFIMLALGIVFSISRYSVHGKIIDNETDKKQGAERGRRLRRSRRADLSGY